ncbi:CDP-glycerol glycerophosphotransferase family protein [Virgibacillus sp. SK37]|uniref:CDP-glycerol glycerophosphotransferase family protein n=1 Tax=Virgibacillus sp. SK37 TaxID=403957 RepID=UPI0004D12A39|nr:CDP-glycerol glycerophosphotransferase family protein [Virgibacillus sp. SK37]AIF44608.1 ribitolphosphotransferase [Virgibacillus sp. SK37]
MRSLPTWKKWYIILYKIVLNVIYKIFTLMRKPNENKFVIALYRGGLEGNLKYIHDSIIIAKPKAEIHLISSRNKMNLGLFNEVIKLSNAKYLILDDYYLPIYLLTPNSNLKVIQVWHAAGAFKKFGYSTVGTRFGPSSEYLKLIPIHSNYTHAYVSSNKIRGFYAEAFNMPLNKVYPLGVPRTDLFFNKSCRNKVIEELSFHYPKINKPNRVYILLAPTYRGRGKQMETSFNMVDEIIEIAPLIKADVRIIYKPHPYTNIADIKRLNNCNNIIVADKFTINEWMLTSDAFITDYSSSVFEFALLYKPMAHFVPDLKDYEKNRGFYQDITEVSDAEIILDSQHLLKWINKRSSNEFFDSIRMVEYNFDELHDVSHKIVNHFVEH